MNGDDGNGDDDDGYGGDDDNDDDDDGDGDDDDDNDDDDGDDDEIQQWDPVYIGCILIWILSWIESGCTYLLFPVGGVSVKINAIQWQWQKNI